MGWMELYGNELCIGAWRCQSLAALVVCSEAANNDVVGVDLEYLLPSRPGPARGMAHVEIDLADVGRTLVLQHCESDSSRVMI